MTNLLFLLPPDSLAQKTGEVTRKGTEEITKLDPFGIGITVIAMIVVFSALLILYLTFKYVARLYQTKTKVKTKEGEEGEVESHEVSGEIYAAIAAAIHLYRSEMHDTEDAVLTIQRIARTYSPWSSKIYGLRKNPK